MFTEEKYSLKINNFIDIFYNDDESKDEILLTLKNKKEEINNFLNIDNLIRQKKYIKKQEVSSLILYNNLYVDNFVSFILGDIYGKYYIDDISSNLKLDSSYDIINNSLENDGFYVNDLKLDDNLCNIILSKINKNFNFKKKEDNSIIKNFEIFNFKQKGTFWILNQKDILQIDEVQQIACDPFILNIAQNYLKCKPILIQSNFWASYSGKSDKTQVFHQDGDDVKFLKIFIYLNDVDLNNGPHSYVKGSIKKRMLLKNGFKISKRYTDSMISDYFGKENIINMIGKKGTIIFEDTKGFHKGSVLKKGHRFILQLLYSASTHYLPKYDMDKEKNKILFEQAKKYPEIFQLCNFI